MPMMLMIPIFGKKTSLRALHMASSDPTGHHMLLQFNTRLNITSVNSTDLKPLTSEAEQDSMGLFSIAQMTGKEHQQDNSQRALTWEKLGSQWCEFLDCP